MPTSLHAVTQALNATFRDYRTEGDPKFLQLAPVVDSNRNGEFLIFTDVARLDDRSAPQVASDSADFLPANFELSRVQYNCDRVVGHSFILPDDAVADLESGGGDLDLIAAAVARGVRPLFGKMVSDFVAEATAALAAPAAGTLDISSGGATYVKYMQDAIREIQLSTGMLPTHWYLGREAAHQLRLLDEVQEGTAISGYTEAGSAVRRTGMITDDQLRAWHRSVLGLELVVEDESKVASDGDAEFIVSTTGVLAISNPGRGEGAFKTLNKTTGRDGNLVQFVVRETGPGQAVGIGVDCDAYYKIRAVGPAAGRKVSLTLS